MSIAWRTFEPGVDALNASTTIDLLANIIELVQELNQYCTRKLRCLSSPENFLGPGQHYFLGLPRTS